MTQRRDTETPVPTGPVFDLDAQVTRRDQLIGLALCLASCGLTVLAIALLYGWRPF